MAQQINLYQPILLVPRRRFSARAMALALAVLGAGLLALGSFLAAATARLKADMAATIAANTAEQQRLEAQLARRPGAPAATALGQELAQARQGLAERRRVLAALQAGSGGAELLRGVAETLPASIWLHEVKRVDGRIEIAGTALDPAALRPWLQALASQPGFGGVAPRPLRIERLDGADAWNFRVVGGGEGGTP